MRNTTLTLRLAEPDDVLDILHWRNDTETRAVSRNVEVIDEQQHRVWFTRVLGDPDHILLLGSHADKKAGMVRFDRFFPAQWEVSIVLAPELRGQRFGEELLTMAIQHFVSLHPEASLVAEIKRNNTASCRLFCALGFVREADDCELARYTLAKQEHK